MKIENYRFIKSMQLPAGWIESTPDEPVDLAAIRTVSPPNNVDVELGLFCSGLSVNKNACVVFRQTLKLVPRVIFDCNRENELPKVDRQLIIDLAEVLGNVGYNQIVITETGVRGPIFALEKLEVQICNSRAVLAAGGWFRKPEDGKRLREFWGLFIDSSPEEANCNVEQIYIESKNPKLQAQYLPIFQECLQSIEWSIK